VIAPIPAEYERPISVRKKPMPTPVAVLIVAGICKSEKDEDETFDEDGSEGEAV